MSDIAKLKFFQVMAMIVGIALLVLTVHMVLRYGFDNHLLDWWAQPHGFLYMVYLVSTAMLGFELRWSLNKMVGVMLAGVVPFLSFYVERQVTRDAKAQVAARAESRR
ncbi:DUF3817 domain-containing protein [soil metagenome]